MEVCADAMAEMFMPVETVPRPPCVVRAAGEKT